MYRVSLRAHTLRRAFVSCPRLATWVAAIVLAPAGALAAAPLPAGAATGGLFPSPVSGQAIAGWGSNDQGQLGTGMATDFALRPVLAVLPSGTRITAVAPGCNFALALTSTGNVLAWGSNGSGQLGNGTAGGRNATPAPVQLPAGIRVTAISAGCSFGLAVTAGGQAYSWGLNAEGELGNGTTGDAAAKPALVRLPPGATVRMVAAGFRHALAVTATGQVLSWGDNSAGELGNGSAGAANGTPAPARVPAGIRVTSVSAGEFDSLAVTSTGRVLGWGTQQSGNLGNGRTDGQAASPVGTLLPPGVRVRQVFAGCFHTIAVTTTGSVLAWGDNTSGQLGIGSSLVPSQPFPVHVRLPLGSRAMAVGGGCVHSVALTSRGQMLAWGEGALLGNGSTSPSLSPTQVQLPAGSFAIGTGGSPLGDFSLALLARTPAA